MSHGWLQASNYNCRGHYERQVGGCREHDRPLDAAASDDANDAKLAIELGAADLTVGRLDAAQLAEFRRLAEATGTHVAGRHLTDVDSYIGANEAFHAFPIRATGIASLAERTTT